MGALAASVTLVVAASSEAGRIATSIFGASLTLLFGISALYHRVNWAPPWRQRMRRMDHAAIFVLIAGSYTPFCMLLPPSAKCMQLTVMWTGALLGIAVAVFWSRAPKILNVILYVAFGWIVLGFLPSLRRVVYTSEIALLTLGGVAYSVGAIIYALRRPDPLPTVFGYHELFHALTIVGAIFHFVAVTEAVRRL